MVHKAFLVLRIQTIDDLRFTHWCQGQDRKGLRLSTCKESRTVYARKVVDLCIQRTNFIDLTTIRTNLVFCNQTAHFCVFHLFQDFSHVPHDAVKFFVVGIFFFVNCCDLVFDCLSCSFTRQFFFNLNRFLKVTVVGCDDFSLQVSIYMKQFHFCFFFPNCRNDFFLEGNQFFNGFVPFKKSFQHDFF